MYQNHLCQFCFIPNRGIFTIFAVIVLVVIGLIGWCAYRFLKKKKPKGAEDKKGEDDENALVDNEEANIEDVSFQNNFGLRYKCNLHPSILDIFTQIKFYLQIEEPEQQEGHGRLKYRLEYDFTTQELKVTVSDKILNISA